jgi:hypothetical protein
MLSKYPEKEKGSIFSALGGTIMPPGNRGGGRGERGEERGERRREGREYRERR